MKLITTLFVWCSMMLLASTAQATTDAAAGAIYPVDVQVVGGEADGNPVFVGDRPDQRQN